MKWKSVKTCFDSRGRQEMCLSSEATGTTVEPNQPPIKLVTVVLSLG